MANKLLWVSVTVMAVIVSCVLIWLVFPVIQSLTQVAYTDPSAANYTFYKAAVGSAPWWMFFLPIIVGGVAVVMILRAPERR
jgi:cell division protein FtsX